MSEHIVLPRSILVSFFMVFGVWLAWVQTTGLTILSSLQHVNLTQALDGIYPTQIFPSRVSLSFDTVAVGKVDELEEDVG